MYIEANYFITCHDENRYPLLTSSPHQSNGVESLTTWSVQVPTPDITKDVTKDKAPTDKSSLPLDHDESNSEILFATRKAVSEIQDDLNTFLTKQMAIPKSSASPKPPGNSSSVQSSDSTSLSFLP